MIIKHLLGFTSSLFLLLPLQLTAQDTEEIKSLEKIFTLRESEAFHLAMKEAKEANVHPQALLEAKFLYVVDTGSSSDIAALAKEMKQHNEDFSLQNSEIFSIPEDWLAVVHYTQALAALEQSDRTAFKAHITEAFWLSPRQGSAFAPHIEQLHLDDAMSEIQISKEQPFIYHTKEGSTTFGELIQNKKALLIHFWSPWSRESEETFEHFIQIAEECRKHDIETISILADPSPEVMTDALSFIKGLPKTPSFQWIIDDKNKPLARTMRLQRFPNFVLLSEEGHVLFNGAANNNQLWVELTSLAPELSKPDSINPLESPAINAE